MHPDVCIVCGDHGVVYDSKRWWHVSVRGKTGRYTQVNTWSTYRTYFSVSSHQPNNNSHQ